MEGILIIRFVARSILLLNALIKKHTCNSYHKFVFKYFDNCISVQLGFVLILCILI